MESTVIAHEQRLTRLEDKLEVNVPVIMARLQQLEEAEQQRQSDKEQERRRTEADLRARAEAAEKALAAKGT